MHYQLGIDIGSVSLNTVILNSKDEIIGEYYDYCHGKPYQTLYNRLSAVFKTYPEEKLSKLAFTGTGGKKACQLLGGMYINEIIAQSAAVARFFPQARTVIEMGGEDSKLLFMENGKLNGKSYLSDFSLNSLCAAGTGSFLDQQAKRIGVTIEKEFGAMALKSGNPPRIAGRCSVFAKSDMIHLQQIGTPVEDIIAGLCFAVARNLKSTLGRGKAFEFPVVFQGGVAANAGMVKAFREILNATEAELIVPGYHASMGAIGAVLSANPDEEGYQAHRNLIELENFFHQKETARNGGLEPLVPIAKSYDKTIIDLSGRNTKSPVFLGVDVGSLSTNIALIDENQKVAARRYLPTASKPIEAIRRGLKEIYNEVGVKVQVKAVGTTGSGRYLTGDFIGADSIQNEITAQATGTLLFDPEVDTIFEIGGQDSKYIQIDKGVIVDFEMNKVCAAGTGSFLEEQAEKLGIDIKEAFADLAFRAENPSRLGERCTVFMESDLNSIQQKGEVTENLVAGLAYSTVYNYINRVVRDKPIGKTIYFQGGVTNNKAVVAAFEKVTGQTIHVPPHFDITGAIGAAILAAENMKPGMKTRFRGFDISNIPYESENFICPDCANHCDIRKISIEGEKPLYYGGICDKYEVEERKGIGKGIPDLFRERVELLLGDYRTSSKETGKSGAKTGGKKAGAASDRVTAHKAGGTSNLEKKGKPKTTIGIPRGLMLFYQQFPFWRTFFEHLGFEVVLSGKSNKKMLTRSIELMTCETCLPVELMHGQVEDLLNRQVDHVFLPFIVNVDGSKDNPTNNCNCPWVQSHPFMIQAAFNDHPGKGKLLIPTFHLRYFNTAFKDEMTAFMKNSFGICGQKVWKAVNKALEAQADFDQAIERRGKEVLANLPADKKAFVIIGRPYNTGDGMLNLNLVDKLIGCNVLPVPLDYLPLKEENVFDDFPMMYWPNGQKILAAMNIINKYDKLHAVYLSNFRCGPDSFILHFIKQKKDFKPFLHLEIDEHSANAGVITRIEAFLDSLQGYDKHREKLETRVTEGKGKAVSGQRVLYFPYARDTVHILSAACRHCGIPSEVLPMQDDKDIELGRKYTNGNECFPFIATTGSFLKKIMEPGADPEKLAFFMPDHNGPCRFGEYNKLHRIIFDKLGYPDVEIVHPSNEDSYASIAPGQSVKWRKAAVKGVVATDLIRKMVQQIRPYEIHHGESDRIYRKALKAIIRSVEKGGKDLPEVLRRYARAFKSVAYQKTSRKPVIVIVGEIFMRDNPYCSSFLVQRLENLGAETLMAPFGEWIHYSTYRYKRDSKWKKDMKGKLKSTIQKQYQDYYERKYSRSIQNIFPVNHEIRVEEMLEHCNAYIHKDYDGDPPLAIGTASILSDQFVSGIVNILPFTCMPGTLNSAVSNVFRKDYDGIPWENFAYDGQDDTSIDTRLQAFMHQAREYARRKGFDKEQVAF